MPKIAFLFLPDFTTWGKNGFLFFAGFLGLTPPPAAAAYPPAPGKPRRRMPRTAARRVCRLSMPFVTNAQIGDSTRMDFLRSLGVGNYDVCYVTISGDFQNSLETTSLLKELGAKYAVSRTERDVQAKFLLRNGADAVTYPEKQLAKWAAIRYTANHIFSYIELGEKHAIIEIAVPGSWQGHSISELDIRRKYGVNIPGVKRNDKTDVNISPETVLDSSLTLLVLGEYTVLKKCFRL